MLSQEIQNALILEKNALVEQRARLDKRIAGLVAILDPEPTPIYCDDESEHVCVPALHPDRPSKPELD